MPAPYEADSPADASSVSRGPAPGDHLGPEDIYELIERRVSRRRLRAAEAHLEACAECVETLAMLLRTERPASREEQQVLAEISEPSAAALLEALRPRMGAGAPRGEWKTIAAAFVVAALLLSLGLFVRERYWLPAASRRAASETLSTLVTMRNATGRIPLRYIAEFERAGVVRSGFDSTDADEQALIDHLRRAVERAPETEALLVLGLLALDTGELEEAEQLLMRVTEARPNSVDAWNGLAVVYYERAQREPDNAYALTQRGLALLRRAERLAPEDVRVLYNFGKFYETLGMHGAAANAWERYLEHDPTSQWAEEASYQLTR